MCISRDVNFMREKHHNYWHPCDAYNPQIKGPSDAVYLIWAVCNHWTRLLESS